MGVCLVTAEFCGAGRGLANTIPSLDANEINLKIKSVLNQAVLQNAEKLV